MLNELLAWLTEFGQFMLLGSIDMISKILPIGLGCRFL